MLLKRIVIKEILYTELCGDPSVRFSEWAPWELARDFIQVNGEAERVSDCQQQT